MGRCAYNLNHEPADGATDKRSIACHRVHRMCHSPQSPALDAMGVGHAHVHLQ